MRIRAALIAGGILIMLYAVGGALADPGLERDRDVDRRAVA